MALKPSLYIHYNQAGHFLRWELIEFAKYFTIEDSPNERTILLTFGPDALESGAHLPAAKRYAVLFPGFRHNPLYNLENRKLYEELISKYYEKIFINPGPLEIAYKRMRNIELYPFSVDTSLVGVRKYRKSINSLLHVSSDSPQKDWTRSELIMQKTGLKYEIYPPRDTKFHERLSKIQAVKNRARTYIHLQEKTYLPPGYVDHSSVIKKYHSYDGFVHVARDIKDPNDGIDGKYTAALIEAGLSGAILFWHDTYGLGNGLQTVFNLPLDPDKAANEILNIKNSIDVLKHSHETHQEIAQTFNPARSVRIRAEIILSSI